LGKLTFAHLSDIHFIGGFSGISAFDLDEAVRKALLLDAKNIRNTIAPVSGILITGDIAFAGKPAEYEIALKWLEQFTDRLDCDREYVWCVPGNHDVDQSALKENTDISSIHDRIRNINPHDDQFRACLENESSSGLIFSPLKTYKEEFASRFDCLSTPKQPWWTDDLVLNDGSILRLRGLNSVLISGLKDNKEQQKMILGAAQTEYGRDEGIEYVTLCHHPIDWLIDGEQREEALLAYSRVQLFGHKHIQKINKIDETLWLSAGAVHPVRKEQNWIPRYNYLSLEVENVGTNRYLSVDVYARVWSQTERMFTREQGSYQGEFKNYKLKLPEWSFEEDLAREPDLNQEAVQGNQEVMGQALLERQEAGMNIDRKKLLYRFISLPHHTRISIMKNYDLWEEADQTRSDAEVFAACFERAKKKGVLDSVWEAIESQINRP
jgi:calcineurin-like phosphoesterase family protein